MVSQRKLEVRRPPTHPGEILREEVFPALGIGVQRAAAVLGLSRRTLSGILAEERSVTPEIAARLGRFCGNGPELWLALQATYDRWQSHR